MEISESIRDGIMTEPVRAEESETFEATQEEGGSEPIGTENENFADSAD